MKTVIRERNGSKWRRSLMALAVLSAPVVSVAGFSGTASAGVAPSLPSGFTATAVADCGASPIEIDVTINVPSDTFKNRTWDISIESVTVQNNLKTANGTPSSDTTESVSWPVPDQQDGYYEVVINLDSDGSGADSGPGGQKIIDVFVDCDINYVSTDVFSVVEECGESDGIIITLETGPNAPYRVIVTKNSVEVEDELIADLSDADLYPNFPVLQGEGTYSVQVIHKQSEKPLKVKGSDDQFEITGFVVDCSSGGGGGGGGGGGYNFTFKLPKVTTAPTLPSTGSDSSTSLLVIAPVMVLLGAGLIMARRRLTTV